MSQVVTTRGVTVLLSFVALAACAEVPLPTDEVVELRLVEDLRYPPSEPQPLSAVRSIAPAPDGSIYVTDSRTSGLLRFDANGSLAAVIGGEGEGPGEFLSLDRVGAVGDSVWVTDLRLGRVSLFDAEGGFLTSWMPAGFQYPEGRAGAFPLTWLAPSTLLLATAVEGEADSVAFLSVVLPGGTASPLIAVETTRRFWPLEPGSSSSRQQPLGHFDLIRPWPGGLVILRRPVPVSRSEASYRVEWHAPEGPPTPVNVAYDPVRTTEDDVTEALRPHAESSFADRMVRIGRYASREAVASAAREGLTIPEYLPPVRSGVSGLEDRSVLVTPDGLVWTERWHRSPGGEVRWDIISQSGVEAEASTPASLRLLAVTNEHAWGVQVDELGIPTIVRFSIVQ